MLFLLIGLPLGGGRFDALYLAAAVALSSTVIIVKVLYEKRELDTLPGRITLGILVMQDLFANLVPGGAAEPERLAVRRCDHLGRCASARCWRQRC